MANTTLKFGNGNWAIKEDSALAYSDQYNNFKPLPFDFSRAGSGTIVNKEGLIETVGNGIPRIDFSDSADGALLLEPQSTNSILQSNKFDTTWNLINASISNNQSGIYNTTNAWKLIQNTNTGYHYIQQLVNLTGDYTYSIYAKKGEYEGISFFLPHPVSGSNAASTFNLSTGIFISDNHEGTSLNIGNGWYRLSLKTKLSGFHTINAYVNQTIQQSETGDGTSGIYIQHAQLEVGSYSTSIIPTQGSAVTRVAESCLQLGFQDKNIFGSTQGSAVFEFKWDEVNYIFDFNVGGVEVIRIYNDNNTQWRIRDTISSSWYFTGFNITQGQRTKIGFKWSGTEIIAFQNGVKSSINGSLGSNIAVQSITINKLNNTSNMQFYNTALTDEELQKLTTI